MRRSALKSCANLALALTLLLGRDPFIISGSTVKEFRIIRDDSSLIDVHELMEGYNKLVRPAHHPNSKTVVDFALNIRESQYKGQKLNIKGSIIGSWMDFRLQYPNDSDRVMFFPKNEIWKPLVLFTNTDFREIQSHTTAEPSGRIRWNRNFEMVVNCPVPVIEILSFNNGTEGEHICTIGIQQPTTSSGISFAWERDSVALEHDSVGGKPVTIPNNTIIHKIEWEKNMKNLKMMFHIDSGITKTSLFRIINNALDNW